MRSDLYSDGFSIYKLFWICFKAVLMGRGKCDIAFDTEGRKFNYHLAKVGSGHVERLYGVEGPYILSLHEERQ